MANILYIEDNLQVRTSVGQVLTGAGHSVKAIPDGATLYESPALLEDQRFDLLILDMTLPHVDGLTLLKRIREVSLLPVPVLSGDNSELDMIDALASGCDDYVTKPIRPAYLLAKVNALLRRMAHGCEDGSFSAEKGVVHAGNLRCCDGECFVEGRPVPLTPTEIKLLRYYLAHPNQPLSRERLLAEVWDMPQEVESRTADEMTRRVRRKLEYAGASVALRSVWGVGYRLETPESGG